MKRILSRGGVFAAALALTCCFGAVVPARAAETHFVKNNDELFEAVNNAANGDTIKLGSSEYEYTLYGKQPNVLNKNLTFVGAGTEETFWRVGPETPNPAYYGTENNSDYSFQGSETVTFKNMTLRVHTGLDGKNDYFGFSHTNNTVVENCVVDGHTRYWGYNSAKFKDTTFEAPEGDYAIWTYCSKMMTFENCTFNCYGKAINVYTEPCNDPYDITVEVNHCHFNFKNDVPKKTALKIDDKYRDVSKFYIYFTGENSVEGTVDTNALTCSKLFGFDEEAENIGRTDVYIKGQDLPNDGLVWTDGKMQTHAYTDGYAEQKYHTPWTTGEWESLGNGKWKRTDDTYCDYCRYSPITTVILGFDLSYDMNGSTDTQTSDFDTVEHVDSSCVIAKATPVRTGYKFAGWNTKADGSGKSYIAGDTFSFDDAADAAPATLYAQWEKVVSPDPAPSSQKPANPTKKADKTIPKTGDVTNAALPAVVAVLAVAVIAVAFLARRKNQE